ncbi:MAG: hypothetical protein HFI39_10310 [Lachnospiraceae bacterium]|nr:hypothetical protein [Lachnospiraceae bacterium]
MDISVADWGLGFVLENFRRFQGEGVFFFFFFLAVAAFALAVKAGWKKDFLKYLLGLCLIVFNPLLVTPVVGKLGMEDEYYRLIWLLPITVCIAWLAAFLVERGKKAWVRALICLACMGCLAFPGKSILAKGLETAENLYKVPNEVVEISEIIHAHSENEQPVVVTEFDLSVLMNQYDPSLRLVLSYGEMNKLREYELHVEEYPDAYWVKCRVNVMWLIEDKRFDLVNGYDLQTSLDLVEAEYVVCTYEEAMHEMLLANRCIEVGQSGNYRVYRYYNCWEEFPPAS